jgi:hypothetical protein
LAAGGGELFPGGAVVGFERDGRVEFHAGAFGVAGVGDDLQIAPVVGHGAVFAPLDDDGLLGVRPFGFEDAAVEISVEGGGVLFGWVEFDPHELVVAGVVIVGEVDVVLPEEVIGDPSAVGVEDGGGILEGERIVWSGENARGEAEDELLLG